MESDTRRPIARLISDVINDVTLLMQAELRLVRVELNEKVGRLANGGVMVGAGAVCLIAGVGIACLALTEWLVVAGVAREWALTIVAAVVLLVGALVAARGVKSIKSTELVPERSLHGVRQDINTIKEHVS
jgi:uncharacterized membrane protein YqjE